MASLFIKIKLIRRIKPIKLVNSLGVMGSISQIMTVLRSTCSEPNFTRISAEVVTIITDGSLLIKSGPKQPAPLVYRGSDITRADNEPDKLIKGDTLHINFVWMKISTN